MANDRSLLAFARTGLTLVVTGLAFLKFLSSDWAGPAGWSMIAAAPLVLVYGVGRFFWIRSRYRAQMRELPE